MLKSLLCLTIGLFVSGNAFAGAFEGQVVIRNSQAFLVMSSAPTELWKIEGLSDQVNSQVKGLEGGDLLSATGELSKLNKTAYIETVDFVGLKRILGRWESQDGFRIYFKDFRSAVVEQKQPLPWNPEEEKTLDLVYAILPLKDENWSLFMSNRKTVRVGTLSIQAKVLSIQLVDQRTGKVTEDISLSPSADLP